MLSLQLHHQRAEHWVVVSGVADVTCGDKTFRLQEDESTYIPVNTPHRLSNPGPEPLEIIEVQSGDYLGEDDIVRLEDSYGRLGEGRTGELHGERTGLRPEVVTCAAVTARSQGGDGPRRAGTRRAHRFQHAGRGDLGLATAAGHARGDGARRLGVALRADLTLGTPGRRTG